MSGAEVLRVVRGKHYSLSRWCRRGSALEVPVVTCQRGGGGKEEEVVMMRLYLGGFIPPTSHQPGHRLRLPRGSQLPRFLSAIRSPSLHVASFSPPPGSPLHLLATFSLRLRPPKLPDITNGKTLWGRVHGLSLHGAATVASNVAAMLQVLPDITNRKALRERVSGIEGYLAILRDVA